MIVDTWVLYVIGALAGFWTVGSVYAIIQRIKDRKQAKHL